MNPIIIKSLGKHLGPFLSIKADAITQLTGVVMILMMKKQNDGINTATRQPAR
jgi:hypothetical protein